MEISLITIAIVGLIVGVISNLLPLFGSTIINFLLAVVLASIHAGLTAMGFNGFSPVFVVFIQWYFVGTFGTKLLAMLPTPIQPFAQIFEGKHM